MMTESARRPSRLSAGRPVLAGQGRAPNADVLPTIGGGLAALLRPLRVVRRAFGVLLWTLPCMPVQAVCLMLPGHAKASFARLYWSVVCRLLGLRVRLIGAPAGTANGRPVVYVSNHSTWLDVPVLGGRLNACFVSKDEVGGWPFVGTIARLGRTVFISRQRHSTGRERDAMRERLTAGDNLVLFPEGTTSDGSRVLPFRSAFFAIADGDGPPLIQPVSVVYDRLGGLPTGRASRPVFAWYGDMDLASHFWRFAQHRGLRASVLLQPPLDPTRFASRKALSHAVWQAVADGAAALRQNRPVSAPPVGGAAAEPAYA
ncbi:MAG: lysophospholipid acyltransferase family protein [Acetobacteraceae bacterium]|jgi:lyso-ornithine lipid O-acyltransferase